MNQLQYKSVKFLDWPVYVRDCTCRFYWTSLNLSNFIIYFILLDCSLTIIHNVNMHSVLTRQVLKHLNTGLICSGQTILQLVCHILDLVWTIHKMYTKHSFILSSPCPKIVYFGLLIVCVLFHVVITCINHIWEFEWNRWT